MVENPEHVATAKALNGVSICCNVSGLLAFVLVIYVLCQMLGIAEYRLLLSYD